jgi:tetratricopeptide (TPR) repeat protein
MNVRVAILFFAVTTVFAGSGELIKSHSEIISAAEAHIERGQYQNAIDTLAPILKADSEEPDAWFIMGQALEGLGQDEEAIEYFIKAAEAGGIYTEAYFNAAYLLFEIERYEESRDNYRAYIDEYPNDAGALYNLGVVYNALGDWNACTKSYEKALLADPKHYNALYNLAVAYYDSGDYTRSIHFWNRLLEIDNKDIDGHYGLGVSLYDSMEYYDAADVFENGVKLAPDDGRFHYQLGRCYYSIYNYADSIDAFSRALELGFMPDEDTYYLGYIFADMHEYDQAIYYLERAMEYNTDAGRPHVEIALMYRRIGKFGQALDSLYMAKRLEYEDMPLLFNLLGLTYLDLGQYDMAAKFLRQSINEETNYTEPHYNLAVTLEHIDTAKAISQWERYINLAQGVPGEKYSLEEAKRRLKRLRKNGR